MASVHTSTLPILSVEVSGVFLGASVSVVHVWVCLTL